MNLEIESATVAAFAAKWKRILNNQAKEMAPACRCGIPESAIDIEVLHMDPYCPVYVLLRTARLIGADAA